MPAKNRRTRSAPCNAAKDGSQPGKMQSAWDERSKSMIVKFKAFATVKEEKYGWKRIAESTHETEIEAEKAAADFSKIFSGITVGTHKYYIINQKEWDNEHYKGVSLTDGKTKTWMTNDGNGCTLLFEGMHFEIL